MLIMSYILCCQVVVASLRYGFIISIPMSLEYLSNRVLTKWVPKYL